jgi:hypothetical protein
VATNIDSSIADVSSSASSGITRGGKATGGALTGSGTGSGPDASLFVKEGVSFGSLFQYALEVSAANKLAALHRRLMLTEAVKQALGAVR